MAQEYIVEFIISPPQIPEKAIDDLNINIFSIGIISYKIYTQKTSDNKKIQCLVEIEEYNRHKFHLGKNEVTTSNGTYTIYISIPTPENLKLLNS
jgi:hypothetical protein